MTAIYKKVGRRYVEIGWHEEGGTPYPLGASLVTCEGNGRFTRFSIDPDYAAVLAAMDMARSAMVKAMNEANKMKISNPTKLTKKQLELLKEARLDGLLVWSGISMYDVVDAGINAVIEKMKESEK